MKSALTLSHQEAIARALIECRNQTLQLIEEIDAYTLTKQAHPDFSPIGWHLGHIAFTEAYWILEQLAGLPPLYAEYRQLFAADGLPKEQRQNLPNLVEIKAYLQTVREKTFDYLQIADLEIQQRLWWWLIQHESQHGETIAIVKKLHSLNCQKNLKITEETKDTPALLIKPKMIDIPAGEFVMGSNTIEAQDNERPAHSVYLEAYSIDAYPVTCGQYQQFITAEGYHNPQYWSQKGWHWLQANAVSQPLYWLNSPQTLNYPVYGVSYYEAEAYANFAEKRLPTEAEWEKAAQFNLNSQETDLAQSESYHLLGNHNNLIGQTTPVNKYPELQTMWGCYDMLGNVWEWTNSWFSPYTGFTSYPYPNYSEAYFDNEHKVLKGGSYVTYPYALRNTFRNWYYPWVRQIFAGFRCAKS